MAINLRGGNKVTYQMFLNELSLFLLGTKKGGGTRRDLQRQEESLFSIERRVIIKLVNKHKPIIKDKFPEVNMADVVNSVDNIFRNAIDIEIRRLPKALKWDNAERTVVAGNSLRDIQNMASKVRNTVRNNAIKNIAISQSEITRQEAIINSVVVGGIDPRLESEGGDVTRGQLEVDVVKGIFKFREGTGQDLARTAKRKKQGFDVGHTFGAATANLAAFVGAGEHPTAITAFFTPSEKLQLIELRDKSKRIDSRMFMNARLFTASGRDKGKITITLAEKSGDNQLDGAQLRPLIAQARKILEKVKTDLITVYGASPSILDLYKQGIIELFLHGKIKRKAYYTKKKTYKSKAKGTKKIPVYGPTFTSYKDSPQEEYSEEGATGLKLLIDLVNRRFHDQIQRNMGKVRSKKVLNYRTGRFARSAELQDLLPSREKNAIGARVKYMRRPYGVFEPGSTSMATPGRSPARIFGISIRQILQEEAIVKLRRVKVVLSG